MGESGATLNIKGYCS